MDTEKLIRLAETNFYGIRNGGELSELMKENFEVVKEQLEGRGIRVIVPERGDDFDENLMEVVEVEFLPEERKEVVLEVVSPGFLSKEKLIKPAKVRVGDGRKETFLKALKELRVPNNYIYSPRIAKNAEEFMKRMGTESLEEFFEVIREEAFKGTEEGEEDLNFLMGLFKRFRSEEDAFFLSDLLVRRNYPVMVDGEEMRILKNYRLVADFFPVWFEDRVRRWGYRDVVCFCWSSVIVYFPLLSES